MSEPINWAEMFPVAVIAAAFFIALGVAVAHKRWLLGWLLGSIVPVVVFPVVELFSPSTAWFGIALVFATVYCMVASAAGLFIAWLITCATKRTDATTD